MRYRYAIALAGALGMAATTLAQGTQPPRKTPPTTAPGGQPKVPPGKTTIGPGASTTTFPRPLFRMDDVSRTLNINARQRERLDAMTQRLQERYQTQYDRISRLPETEQRNRLMQLNREYSQSWLGSAKDVLNAEQLARYQQLQLQYGGFSTFNDPAIQRQLNLTDAQMKQLNEALLWSNDQTQQIIRQAQTDPNRAREAYTTFNRSYQERLNRILNEQQRRSWSDMTGATFPFPPPFGEPTTGGTTTPKR